MFGIIGQLIAGLIVGVIARLLLPGREAFPPGALGWLLTALLGIAGAFQKQRKKLFPILGIVLNGLLVLIAAIICILALSLIVASLGRVT